MKENENYIRFENDRESEPKKTILRVVLMRHGPKATASGEKDKVADNFDESVTHEFKQLDIGSQDRKTHISSSPLDRAKKSAEIGGDALIESGSSTKSNIVEKDYLATPYRSRGEAGDEKYADDFETIVSLQEKLEPGIRKAVELNLSGASSEEREGEIRNRIDIIVLSEIINDEKKVLDEKKFKVSYERMADNLANHYFSLAKHIGMLEKRKVRNDESPPEPYRQIDVSHSYPITAFLKKYLVFEDGREAIYMDPQDFFDKTGGIVRESGSLTIDYIRNEKGDLIMEVSGEFMAGKKFKGTINQGIINKKEK